MERGNIIFFIIGVGLLIILGASLFLLQQKSNSTPLVKEPVYKSLVPVNTDSKQSSISSTPQLNATPKAAITTSPVKEITYKKIDGWTEYNSPTGYSFQRPESFNFTTFHKTTSQGEEIQNGRCVISFGNNVGGIIQAQVVPYSGGSRRELFFSTRDSSDEYNKRYNQFEEIIIQGEKSLIIEPQKPLDYGEGFNIVIPVGKTALIFSWDNRTKDSSEATLLLQSIKINEPLSIEKCGK